MRASRAGKTGEFYLRIADKFDFALVPEPLTIKRDGRSDQISRDIQPLLEETYPAFESILVERAEKYGTWSRNRALAELRNEVADAALMNRDARIARRFLIYSLLVYPFNLKTLSSALSFSLWRSSLPNGYAYEDDTRESTKDYALVK